MRLHPRHSRRGRNEVSLDLASMIDITFLLLVYFIVTMVVMADEDYLSPTLQTDQVSAAASASDFQVQEIHVKPVADAPAYVMGSATLRDRAALLEQLRPLPKTVGIVVRVHGGVPVEFAVAAIQIARDVGFEQVTYVPVK